MNNKKGFTLVELLVVIAIIGLIAVLAIISLSSARIKARDARRVSDIRQIQTALELYNDDQGTYPGEKTPAQLAGGDCMDTTGWKASGTCAASTYISGVLGDPTGSGSYVYTYSPEAGPGYSITFQLENGTSGLASGAHTATQNGIQ